MPTSARRWYMWLPLAVVGGSTLLLIALWLCVLSLATGPRGTSGQALVRIAAVSTGGVLLLHLCMVVWTAWVVPVLAAGDPKVAFSPTPRRYRATLRGTLFTPVIITLCLGVGIAVVIVAVGLIEDRGWRIDDAMAALWPFAVVAIVLGSIGAAADRPLRRRFKRQMTLRPDCFACGYNLTGVASPTCPECGASKQFGRE